VIFQREAGRRILGGVAERLIAPVLKTGRPKGLVSSNLTPSATLHSIAGTLCLQLLYVCANEDSNAVRLAGRDSAGLQAKLSLQSQSAALANLTLSAS
jgi:hypothetical protein